MFSFRARLASYRGKVLELGGLRNTVCGSHRPWCLSSSSWVLHSIRHLGPLRFVIDSSRRAVDRR
jgi:hypothetical protein